MKPCICARIVICAAEIEKNRQIDANFRNSEIRVKSEGNENDRLLL